MNDIVSRRDFLGVLGAGALLPAAAGGQTFTASGVPVTSRELWAWMRTQLVLQPGLVWLDTASVGPVLRAVMVREYRSRERQSLDPATYRESAGGPGELRRHLGVVAGLLGADAEDLAFTTGTTEGLNLAARGLDLQPGDEVLTTAHERGAAIYPWLLEAKRRGIRIVQLSHDGTLASPESIVGRFAGAVTPRTRVMAFAHVQSTDGTVMPVRELCALARGNAILTVVDGALGPGLLDFRLADLACDVYATAGHRWLSASYGTGILYVRREARARFWPLAVDDSRGWEPSDRFGVAHPSGDVPGSQGRFGALGRYQVPSLEGLGIAVEFQQAVNRARVGARILELAAYLRSALSALPAVQVLTPNHPSLSTGIVAIRIAGRDHAAIAQALAREDRIVVAHVARGPAFDGIRVSLHAHIDHDEIDRLVNALRRRA